MNTSEPAKLKFHVPVAQTNTDCIEPHRGKVRDIYDLGRHLLIIGTDRISAFDWVLPTAIPDKGRILTELSKFWLGRLTIHSHHLVETDVDYMRQIRESDTNWLRGRTMLVKKCRVIPIECIVRGYLAGSGWKEYQENGSVCGISLPAGLVNSSQLPKPIFTPSTKAPEGEHDVNVTFGQMCAAIESNLKLDPEDSELVASRMRSASVSLYCRAAEYAQQRGIIIADTKLEWGLDTEGDLTLIDEVFTPDSSRFWPTSHYQIGHRQPSFDKQFVRDWLTNESGWDRNSPPPVLPDHIVMQTRAKYIEAFELLTEQEFPWK